MSSSSRSAFPFEGIHPADAFSRLDESDDAIFYATNRFAPHLDARARG